MFCVSGTEIDAILCPRNGFGGGGTVNLLSSSAVAFLSCKLSAVISVIASTLDRLLLNGLICCCRLSSVDLDAENRQRPLRRKGIAVE